MATRTTRTGISINDVLATLSNREKLLFAQVLYELGANDWTEVSKLLIQHPLIDRPKGFFSPQLCYKIYVGLMKENGQDFSDGISDDAKRPKAKINLSLAQKCYKDRVTELKAEITAQEEKFSVMAREIMEIQTGKWDEAIANEIQKGLAESHRKNKSQVNVPQPPVSPTRRSTRSTKEEPAPVPATEPLPLVTHGSPEDTISDEDETDERIEPEAEEPEDQPMEERPPTPEPETAPQEPTESVTSSAPPSKSVESLDVPNLPRMDEQPAVPREPSPVPDGETEDVQPAEPSETGLSPPPPAEEVPETPVETEPAESPVEAEPRPRRGERRRNPRTSKAEHSTTAASASKERKRTREASEPAAEPEGPSNPKRPRASTTTQAPAPSKRFQNIITMLLGTISQHRNGNIFHNPIKLSDAPDYPDMVKRPMDLKTIKTKIKDGTIKDSQDFQRDIYLMYANAIMYNRPDSDISRMAEEMMIETEGHIENHRQTEGFRAP
ncbi:hypothetical protein FRC02_012029 [Tulasnella sp. 418]|nr:hypothetical protein FRC02_012029 [Tulasnella sp. 418]